MLNKLNHKTLITGTGKSGTTFLMHLLTHLGFDTGFEISTVHKHMTNDGGLEIRIRGEHAREESPYIIKSPSLCFDLLERKEKWNWYIDHLYISVRSFSGVALHKLDAWKIALNTKDEAQMQLIEELDDNKRKREREFLNSLTENELIKLREDRAAAKLGYLIEQLVDREIPHTFIRFPKSVTDPYYCFNKLNFLLKDMPFEEFVKSHNSVADPKKVHY